MPFIFVSYYERCCCSGRSRLRLLLATATARRAPIKKRVGDVVGQCATSGTTRKQVFCKTREKTRIVCVRVEADSCSVPDLFTALRGSSLRKGDWKSFAFFPINVTATFFFFLYAFSPGVVRYARVSRRDKCVCRLRLPSHGEHVSRFRNKNYRRFTW